MEFLSIIPVLKHQIISTYPNIDSDGCHSGSKKVDNPMLLLPSASSMFVILTPIERNFTDHFVSFSFSPITSGIPDGFIFKNSVK